MGLRDEFKTRLRAPASATCALLACGAVLAGCGGTGSTASNTSTSKVTTARAPAASPSQNAVAQIKRTWATFFKGSTPAATRVALLQDGQRYKAVVQAQSKSGFAQQTRATVSRVRLTSPTTASVRYTIVVAGAPALKDRTGTAVKVGGSWKVADRTFCQLLGLEGSPPPLCRRA